MNAINFVAQRLGSQMPNASTPLANLLHDDIKEVTAKADALHATLLSFRA